MVRSQHHRGPDDQGIYLDPRGGAALGHNRLSIIDLSPAGHQPMASAGGRYFIVFNGEIYNYLELRRELDGYPFRSQTDTEVILAAYERWGSACLDRFIGMFAFAIWDSETQTLFAARDRIGIKPFYYTLKGDSLYFGSEIKSLLAAGIEARRNDAVIWDYLARGLYDHTEQTFFQGVQQLAPGHTLTWRAGNLQTSIYWDLPTIVAGRDQSSEPRPEWRDELEELLLDAVRLRLRSDVPVGLHLTGGLDSSSVLALLSSLMPQGGRIHGFTATYGDSRYDEAIHASEASGSLKVDLHVCPMPAADFWCAAERTQWHQEQPFGGVATAAYWGMEQEARRHGIIVLLEGQGGDELFGGYPYFLPELVADLEETGRSNRAQSLMADYGHVHNKSTQDVRRQVEKLRAAGSGAYQDGSEFLRPGTLTPAFRTHEGTGYQPPRSFRGHFTNARYRDLRHTKLQRVLRFNDRMSMAHSLELRVPLLDHRIVEYSFTLPGELLLHNGLPKYPLRAALAGRLPDSLRLAPKRDVVTPQREWFSGPMREEIRCRLTESRAVDAGYLERDSCVSSFDEFCAGRGGNNAFFIWQWLNLDLWMRTFNPV